MQLTHFALTSSRFDLLSQDLDGQPKYHNGPCFASDAISKIALLPVIPIVRKGARTSLEHHHLWNLKKRHATANAWREFETVWEHQKTLPEYVSLPFEHRSIH